MSNGLLNRIRKKDEVNKRLFLSILVLFLIISRREKDGICPNMAGFRLLFGVLLWIRCIMLTADKIILRTQMLDAQNYSLILFRYFSNASSIKI